MTAIQTLLADDHDLIRAGLKDALNGINNLEICGEVGTGPDLWMALHKYLPDLLVVDVNMPDFEPVATMQQIRAKFPELKILVVSAYDDQGYVIGLLGAGVNGYHLKDQPLSDLLLAVHRILDGGRWISDPLVGRLLDQHTTTAELPVTLTRRQSELLYLIHQGYGNQKIALVMGLSVKTIENHLTALYRVIKVESRLEANNFASRHPECLIIPAPEKVQYRPVLSVESIAVLLVDDNPRYRTQLAKLIEKICPSALIYEAENTLEAIRVVELIKPRLAFVDVVLQDEDGIKCARRMKTACPKTRTVLVSAYPDREFRRLGLDAGAVAFLDKKDIDAATVRQVIEDSI